MDKNIEFLNIIRNSSPDFQFKEELTNIHQRIQHLDSSIKLRKEMEYEFNKLKLGELNDKLDELQWQKTFFIKRNKNIIDLIQKNNFTSMELSSKSNQLIEIIKERKDKYSKYLDSLKLKIGNEFMTLLFSKDNNIFKLEKENELYKLKENEFNKDFYEYFIEYNEKLVNEIKELKKKNYQYSLKNKENEIKFLQKENELKNDLANYNPEKDEKELIIKNEYLENIKSKDRNNIMNEEYDKKVKKENLDMKLKYKKLQQYILNMNHNFGILDKLEQERIDKLNKKLKEQYIQSNVVKKEGLISQSMNEFDDYQEQKVNPQNIPISTINQNFIEKNINDITDNGKKEKTISSKKESDYFILKNSTK